MTAGARVVDLNPRAIASGRDIAWPRKASPFGVCGSPKEMRHVGEADQPLEQNVCRIWCRTPDITHHPSAPPSWNVLCECGVARTHEAHRCGKNAFEPPAASPPQASRLRQFGAASGRNTRFGMRSADGRTATAGIPAVRLLAPPPVKRRGLEARCTPAMTAHRGQ